ncbi:MAG: hypothetical protein AAGI66_01680 [Cyanobacteria bacterium P01_H01_bin.74]
MHLRKAATIVLATLASQKTGGQHVPTPYGPKCGSLQQLRQNLTNLAEGEPYNLNRTEVDEVLDRSFEGYYEICNTKNKTKNKTKSSQSGLNVTA